MQGNCTKPSNHISLQPARQSDRQCVLDIFEDFVELQHSNLWLHDIYLRLVGDAKKDHATYFGAHNGNLWLTQCVMRGDGFRARAVDTLTPWRGYARGVCSSKAVLEVELLRTAVKVLKTPFWTHSCCVTIVIWGCCTWPYLSNSEVVAQPFDLQRWWADIWLLPRHQRTTCCAPVSGGRMHVGGGMYSRSHLASPDPFNRCQFLKHFQSLQNR